MKMVARPKIFVVAPGPLEIPTQRGGGEEKALVQLAINSKIFDFVFISPKPLGISNRSKKLSDNVEIKYSYIPAISYYPGRPYFGLSSLGDELKVHLFYIHSFFLVLRSSRYIDVLVVTSKFAVLLLILAKILRIRTIYRDAGTWPWIEPSYKRPFFHKINFLFGKLSCELSSTIMVTSLSIKRGMYVHGIRHKEIFVVPNGVNVECNSKYSRTPYKKSNAVLYLGRLEDSRGANFLVDIIQETLKMKKDVSFIIVGDGPYFRSLCDFVAMNGLEANVRLLGQIPHSQVCRIIQEADVALFISPVENYPSLALLECLASGCPVIATDVGDTRLIVKDHYNGVLVPPEPYKISHAIIRTLEDTNMLRTMSSNARKSIFDHTWKSCAGAFSKCLIACLSKSSNLVKRSSRESQ
jgi:glycosyltransferase involved in cell wall biosynthesis